MSFPVILLRAASAAFQSLPGSAAILCDVCRTLISDEGMWMIAQNRLMGILFFPVPAHIRSNLRFVLLFKHTRPMETLCADWLTASFCIGGVAAIAFSHDEPRRALLACIPAIIAVVYIKNSGMFFAAVEICALANPSRPVYNR